MNGVCHGPVQVQHAELFPRGPQQHAEYDAIAPSAMDWSSAIPGRPRRCSTEPTRRGRSTAGRVLADRRNRPTGGSPRPLASGPQHAAGSVGPVGQHDRAALGVEALNGVVQDRVEQFVFVLDVDEVVAGPQQGDQLLAGPRRRGSSNTRSSIASSHDELVDASTTIWSMICGSMRRGSCVRSLLTSQCHLAELDHVLGLDRLFPGPYADAVDVGAVRALEVAEHPAGRGLVPEFGVPPTDGTVVENDLQGPERPVRRMESCSQTLPFTSSLMPLRRMYCFTENPCLRVARSWRGKLRRFYGRREAHVRHAGGRRAAARSMQPGRPALSSGSAPDCRHAPRIHVVDRRFRHRCRGGGGRPVPQFASHAPTSTRWRQRGVSAATPSTSR